ncbi:hypothetical protein Tco_1393945 [Tanacetum coccineum]
MPEWGLRDDLRICSFRSCKEMITHLDTPIEDEFLGGELLKRHEQLNIEHIDLRNRCNVQMEELSHLRIDLQRQTHANDGISKKFLLLDSVHSSYEDKKRELLDQLKEMEKERDDWRKTASEQETSYEHRVQKEFGDSCRPMLHRRMVGQFESRIRDIPACYSIALPSSYNSLLEWLCRNYCFTPAVGLRVCNRRVHLLDLPLLAPTLEWVIHQLCSVFSHDHSWKSKSAHNVLLDELLNFFTGDFSQRLRLHPLGEIVNLHNDELELVGALRKRLKDVETPLVKGPRGHDGRQTRLRKSWNRRVYLARITLGIFTIENLLKGATYSFALVRAHTFILAAIRRPASNASYSASLLVCGKFNRMASILPSFPHRLNCISPDA